MTEGRRSCDPTPLGPMEESLLDEIGFMDDLQGLSLLTDRHRQAVQSDRSAVELLDQCQQEAPVHLVQSPVVDSQHLEGLLGHRACDHTIPPYLGHVTGPAEKPVGNAGSAATPAGEFSRALSIKRHVEHPRRTLHDPCQLFRRVEIKAGGKTESGPEGAGEHSGPRGRADQREAVQVELHRPGAGTAIDQNIEPEVFHGAVKVFLDNRTEPVDLVDEEDIGLLDAREQAGQITGTFEDRTGS